MLRGGSNFRDHGILPLIITEDIQPLSSDKKLASEEKGPEASIVEVVIGVMGFVRERTE